MSKILNGKKLSEILSQKLARNIRKLNVTPKLVILQVGNLKESDSYIKKKRVFAKRIGALTLHKRYPKTVKEADILMDIRKFNSDKSVHGIMVQLPIPGKLNTAKILRAINPSKDVDGLTGKSFVPATTQGILTLLKHYKVGIKGKRVVVVGDSFLVGKPTAEALSHLGAKVMVCNDRTKDLKAKTKSAEILVVAAGHPNLISAEHVSRSQIIVDVGINVLAKGKVVGDVDFNSVKKMVKAITPVPGGVGPMTVYSLFENLLEAASKLV